MTEIVSDTTDDIIVFGIQGPQGIPGAGFPYISATGLSLTINGFSLLDANGNIIDIPTQTITVIANKTLYIMLDLGNLTYYQLNRACHSGAICICVITTNDGIVINIKNTWFGETPKTAIPNFLSKLNTAQYANDMRVAIAGASLEAGAGGAPYWWQLVFDATYAAQGYNLPNLDFITVDNYAVGGQTSSYGLVLIGEGSFPNEGYVNNTAMAFAPSAGHLLFSPPKAECGRSPLLKQPYDLLIIGFGANGGTYDYAYLENIIIEARKVGTEVALVTENFRSDNADFLLDHLPFWERMCNAHGCALIDTWAYMLAGQNAGDNVFADTIHPSTIGQTLWAKAVYSVLNPFMPLISQPAKTPKDRVIRQMEGFGQQWGLVNNSCQIQFTPSYTTGALSQPTTVTEFTKNPALFMGNKTIDNAVTELAVDKYARYAHPWAFGVDFLFDASSAFTANICNQNGDNILGTIELTELQLVSGRCILLAGISGADYADLNSTGRNNQPIQLVITSGTAKVIGAVFHCDKMVELDIATDIKYNGTFAKEPWIWNCPTSQYSDTDGDYISIDYIGSDLVVYPSSRDAAGIIDGWIDGNEYYNQEDLYQDGDYLQPLYFPAQNLNDINAHQPSKHSVQIKLDGANEDAATPGAANRRLGIIAAHVFDRS